MRPQRSQTRGVLGHADWIRAQQLAAHGDPRGRATALVQLGYHTAEGPLGQQRVRHADEFRNAMVDAAHAGQHIAQSKIQQTLHRGEQHTHDKDRLG
jgi:hypothetical protein